MIRADPHEYVQRYGVDLKAYEDLPDFVKNIQTPTDVGSLASEQTYNQVHELEGDLEALKLVDLEKEGLEMYKSQIYGLTTKEIKTQFDRFIPSKTPVVYSEVTSQQSSTSGVSSTRKLITQIFEHLDKDGNGFMSREEAASIFLRINSRLGRSYGQMEVDRFFARLDKNGNGQIEVVEFREAFETLI